MTILSNKHFELLSSDERWQSRLLIMVTGKIQQELSLKAEKVTGTGDEWSMQAYNEF